MYKGYVVRYVDGFKIRNTVDDDFGIIARASTAIARFAPKFYIPPREVWVEAPFHDELDFLIRGEFYTDEHPAFADMSYHKLRAHLKKELCLTGEIPSFKKTASGADPVIVLVEGSIIRRYLDPDFILGGHGYVYDYIPKNEIWLDSAMDARELPFIEEHERIERNLMKQGAAYDEAHDIATAYDKRLRREKLNACYPGDRHYPWYGSSNEEILRTLYV